MAKITKEELESLGFRLHQECDIYYLYRLENFTETQDKEHTWFCIDFTRFKDRDREEVEFWVNDYDCGLPVLNKQQALRLSKIIQTLFKE
jgi:hypothetical protein